jgi:hypothetical protein
MWPDVNKQMNQPGRQIPAGYLFEILEFEMGSTSLQSRKLNATRHRLGERSLRQSVRLARVSSIQVVRFVEDICSFGGHDDMVSVPDLDHFPNSGHLRVVRPSDDR